MKRKSRYSTIKAETHKPIPKEAANASSTNKGRNATFTGGTKRYQTISTARNIAEIRKSTKLVITLLAGTTRRGKYTFEIRLELATRLLPLSERAVAKNCQGRIP